MRNAPTRHSNAKAGSASSEGSACRFTTWSRKGVVGTLGTYPGRGLRDNVRVGRPEHKAHFAYRNAWRSPDPLDGSECGQECCLSRQEFKLDWIQRLKGIPLKASQDELVERSQEDTRGDLAGFKPSGTPQEPNDQVMLPKDPAVHCIVMCCDSSDIHFQGGGVTAHAPTSLAGKKAQL